MGVDNIKWIQIFYVIVQHISDDYVWIVASIERKNAICG